MAAEEYRAIKYCNLCSQNNPGSPEAVNYMRQAMTACEDAIKTKEISIGNYSKDRSIAYILSDQISRIKTALTKCISCTGNAEIRKTLESMLKMKSSLVLDIKIRKYHAPMSRAEREFEENFNNF